MAYANVQNSGFIASTGTVSWTPGTAPTLNNLLTGRFYHGGGAANIFGASDCKDSSGTPKTYTQDVTGFGTNSGCSSIYSLIVPSGLTTPLQETSAAAGGNSMQAIFDEWSGNATSSPLDQTNIGNSTTTNTSSGTGPSINTGASAGLVLSAMVERGVGTNAGIAVTGTSFNGDGIEQNNSSFDSGAIDSRTASAASQTGLHDSWTWTAGATSNEFQASIASYKVPAGSATFVPELTRTLLGVGF